MVGTGLACRIWAVGRIRRLFREFRIVRLQRAEHLVGRDLEIPETLALGGRPPVDHRAGRFEHTQRAGDVGLDESVRALDRAVDMALGGEVGDGVEPLALEQALDQRAIEDRAFDEAVARIGVHTTTIRFLQVTRISQRVEHHHTLGTLCQQMGDQILPR